MVSYFDDEHNSQVIFLPLPHGVNEAVCPNPDGSYTILISSEICPDKQKVSLLHALSHVQNDDFWRGDVNRIEAHAHGKNKAT